MTIGDSRSVMGGERWRAIRSMGQATRERPWAKGLPPMPAPFFGEISGCACHVCEWKLDNVAAVVLATEFSAKKSISFLSEDIEKRLYLKQTPTCH